MVIAWHNVVGLRDVTHIVVKIISPFKIISLLAHRGLCLPFDDIFPCWFCFGLLEKQILFGGCKRVHLSLCQTLCLAASIEIQNKEK